MKDTLRVVIHVLKVRHSLKMLIKAKILWENFIYIEMKRFMSGLHFTQSYFCRDD